MATFLKQSTTPLTLERHADVFPAFPEIHLYGEYRFTEFKNQQFFSEPNTQSFLVELGEQLANLSVALQKRWVRNLVKKQLGIPIKNPTQKIYVWDHWFKETKNIATSNERPPRWLVVVAKPGNGIKDE